MDALVKPAKSLPYLSKPSKEEFAKLKGTPLVFKDSIENEWASKLSFNSIKQLIPDIEIKLRRSLCNQSERVYCNLHRYIDYICEKSNLENCFTENPSTGKNWFGNFTPEDKLYCLEMDVNYNDELAKFFSCPEFMGDWFDLYLPLIKKSVVEGKRHTWFFIGPQGTLSELHTDHDSIHTTIQQCCGSKRFFTIQPEQQIWLESQIPDDLLESLRFELKEDTINITSILPDKDSAPILEKVKDVDIYFNDLKSGDVIYLPSMTGHYAESLSDSIGVSRDFIDETNVDKYLFSCIFSSQVFEVATNVIPFTKLQKLTNEYESLKI